MILYLGLVILFGLIFLISLAILIIGAVKRKNALMKWAAIGCLAAIVAGTFSGIAYAKKVYAYANSKKFQNDLRKASELAGETAGSAASGVAKGVVSGLSDDAITALAKKSGNILGKSIKAIASSLDSTVGYKNIYTDQSLANAGLVLGRAEEHYDNNKSGIAIYIDYTQPFKGILQLTNYDQTGKKIDIVEQNINVKANKGSVTTFMFPYSNGGVTTYYILSKK